MNDNYETYDDNDSPESASDGEYTVTEDSGDTVDTETADEISPVPDEYSVTDSDGCGCGSDGCGCPQKSDNNDGNSDGCGCGTDIGSSPKDEQAATCDCEFGCDCESGSARKKCELDDYEIISDVLGSEKQLVKLYSTALCESAEEPLRDVIRNNLIECAKDQYATFEYMEKRGMYELEQASGSDIRQAQAQFKPLCDN